MCFSAGGSFAASGVLVGAGAISGGRATPAGRLFAAVPMLFAVQQGAEGIVWLTVDAPAHKTLEQAAVYTFLGVALVVWPTWGPLSLRRMEAEPARRRTLAVLAWIGVAVSVSAAFLLARAEPMARIDGHSIRYEFGGGAGVTRQLSMLAVYVIPTVLPFFVSTSRMVRVIGSAFVVSVAIAAVIRHEALTSVWCFFAAIVSVLVVSAVRSPTIRI